MQNSSARVEGYLNTYHLDRDQGMRSVADEIRYKQLCYALGKEGLT